MPCYGSFRESLWEIIWKFQLLIICWKRGKNSFPGLKRKLSSISTIRQTVFKSAIPFIKLHSPVCVLILKKYTCERLLWEHSLMLYIQIIIHITSYDALHLMHRLTKPTEHETYNQITFLAPWSPHWQWCNIHPAEYVSYSDSCETVLD